MLRTFRLLVFASLAGFLFTSCEKELSEENGFLPGNGGGSSGTAIYTFDGAPGNCLSPVISGTYTVGTALNSSNTVAITVNVTTPGTYNVSTASSNGISFSTSGSFVSSGPQTIVLVGSGAPTAATTSTYTPGASGCSFNITAVAAGPVAVFTLDGAPAACTTPVIAGAYIVGVPLDGSNTITVTANVTTAGAYSLSTNTANGITFSNSGTLAVGAGQTIVLSGSGTPLAGNTSTFTIGTNGCTFDITSVVPPPATYTLDGAPGACAPINVNGDYFTGNALNGTVNIASVSANVTVAGAYTITTNTVNGMTFSKSGVFTTTGSQTVDLAGSGTPVAVGTNTFTVGTGGCTFDVIVTAPTSPCTGLVDGKFVMTGQFTLDGFSFGISLGTTYQVTIQQSPVQLDVIFPGGTPPAPGTYSVGSVTMHCLNSDFTDWNATSGTVYVGSSGGNTVVEFCNVNFTGTPITGPNISSTGAGKMVF